LTSTAVSKDPEMPAAGPMGALIPAVRGWPAMVHAVAQGPTTLAAVPVRALATAVMPAAVPARVPAMAAVALGPATPR
jgi:hypothetical protein